MENLTGGTPPVRPLPCVVPCKLYFAEVYTSADPELQRLRLFRDAADYAGEVAQPVDPEEDYSAYAAQAMETDSRIYAATGVQEYYDRIAAYMAQN